MVCGYSYYVKLHIHIHTCMHTYIYIYIYIYIYAHAPPPPHPMIHTKLLFLSSGSWEVGSLGCENIGRDQISPKFLKPEMRKHRQGSNFPKIPKIRATIARALSTDARSLGNLGKFDPCRCFRISGFRNVGEILAWQHFSNLGCENIGRDQISPKFLQPEMRKHRQGSNFPKIPKI